MSNPVGATAASTNAQPSEKKGLPATSGKDGGPTKLTPQVTTGTNERKPTVTSLPSTKTSPLGTTSHPTEKMEIPVPTTTDVLDKPQTIKTPTLGSPVSTGMATQSPSAEQRPLSDDLLSETTIMEKKNFGSGFANGWSQMQKAAALVTAICFVFVAIQLVR